MVLRICSESCLSEPFDASYRKSGLEVCKSRAKPVSYIALVSEMQTLLNTEVFATHRHFLLSIFQCPPEKGSDGRKCLFQNFKLSVYKSPPPILTVSKTALTSSFHNCLTIESPRASNNLLRTKSAGISKRRHLRRIKDSRALDQQNDSLCNAQCCPDINQPSQNRRLQLILSACREDPVEGGSPRKICSFCSSSGSPEQQHNRGGTHDVDMTWKVIYRKAIHRTKIHKGSHSQEIMREHATSKPNSLSWCRII
ncbi:uncharacterized protein HD556DRAFT_1317056 [Suillus plorans]|uniref:Uncharacterized protein n=1 Tax=Suillus plorans TaxID=116603 RepID=A0A9P7E3J5_9AGAM|nr:uncharacterized protein HD556DRAFT_1317056 [Suillus plorans]KAG1809972.1 hypothetical protein HD556DRAFT_1317056 [Suillus plorans]